MSALYQKVVGWVKSIQPLTWVLLIALWFAINDARTTSRALKDVCGMAQEATYISTPVPTDPKAMLQAIEKPSDNQGYIGRALWRWQQIDGEHIDKICDDPDRD